MRITPVVALFLVAGAAGAQSAAPTDSAPSAAAQVEARFASWLGCWRLEEDVEEEGPLVCITPDGSGVRLRTTFHGQPVADESLRADGLARPIVEAGCQGTERTESSKDGLRLFRYLDVTCGTEGRRLASAILFLAPGPTWVNVEMVGGGDSRMLRVQPHRRVIDGGPSDADPDVAIVGRADAPSTQAESSWDVDDVIEASKRMPADVVQAALAEAGARFTLNRRSLIALADAGVPEATIDVMIGLTYPRRFDVRQRGGGSSSMTAGSALGWYDPFFYWGSSYDTCYSEYYGYQSYYGHGCGVYHGDWYGSGGWVPVDPSPGRPIEGQPRGRVVNGRGYTQVFPREPDRVRGSAEGGYGTASSSGASSGTSGVSTSGYSSGSAGSSGDSGRVAVPRTP